MQTPTTCFSLMMLHQQLHLLQTHSHPWLWCNCLSDLGMPAMASSLMQPAPVIHNCGGTYITSKVQ